MDMLLWLSNGLLAVQWRDDLQMFSERIQLEVSVSGVPLVGSHCSTRVIKPAVQA